MQELPAVSIAVIKNLMILQKVNLSVFAKTGQQIVIIVRRDGQRLVAICGRLASVAGKSRQANAACCKPAP